MMTANIFNIQAFSTQDGYGVRTTVFFKGCNMHCLWCHNPESLSRYCELQFHSERCINCLECVKLCHSGAQSDVDGIHSYNKNRCTRCGDCVKNCYSNALVMIGKKMTVDEVFERVFADRMYYGENGGVTVSGGESLLQSQFIKELFELCKSNGITTAIDTAGNVDFESIRSLLPVTDMFLYDIKAVDSNLHKQLTGVGNERIIANLRRLSAVKARIIIRIPCVVGGNFDDIRNAVALLCEVKPELVELLPYHRLGESKARSLGIKCGCFDVPTNSQMHELCEWFRENGINTRYSGEPSLENLLRQI